MCGGIGGASSSLFVALPFRTAVYSSSTVCGVINGDASALSVAGLLLNFGFSITAEYQSSTLYGEIVRSLLSWHCL